MSRVSAVLAFLLLAGPALAQPMVTAQTEDSRRPEDTPIGAPYRTGERSLTGYEDVQVSLRDFLSSQTDQLRSEFFTIIDERDKQYAQRFAAQQETLRDTFLSSEKSVANALAAAKEAVAKAEAAAEKRFEGVNEFRDQLRDQATTFMSKEAALASFKAIDEKLAAIAFDVNRSSSRLDAIKAVDEGGKDTFGYIIGVAGFAIGAIALFLNFRKQQGAHP